MHVLVYTLHDLRYSTYGKFASLLVVAEMAATRIPGQQLRLRQSKANAGSKQSYLLFYTTACRAGIGKADIVRVV